jgi:O-antigen ligase
LAYTEKKDQGLFSIEKQLSLLVFPFIFVTFQPTSKIFLLILKAFIFSIVFAFVVSLLYALQKVFILGIDISVADLSYLQLSEKLKFHPTYFGMYLNFSSVILFYFYMKTNRIGKFLAALLIFFSIIAIFLLSSKISILLELFFLILAVIFFVVNSNNKIFLYLLLLLLISLVFSTIWLDLSPRLKGEINGLDTNQPVVVENLNSIHMRIESWVCSWQQINNNYIWGVGSGDVEDELNKCYEARNENIMKGYNSHSQYLQSWLSTGLFGLLSLLLLYFFSLVLSVRNKDYLHLGFIFIIIVVSITESLLVVYKGVVFFCFFNSLFLFNHKGC